MTGMQKTVRQKQMLLKFPVGSFARVKPHASPKPGQVVQIIDAEEGLPMRFKVLVKPFSSERKRQKHKNHVIVHFRDLVPLNEMEVLAEASRC
jgi:hypothetical protein